MKKIICSGCGIEQNDDIKVVNKGQFPRSARIKSLQSCVFCPDCFNRLFIKDKTGAEKQALKK